MLTDEQIAFAWLDFGQAVGGTRPTTPTPYHFARALERIFIAAERERCSKEFVENGRAISRAEEREQCAKQREALTALLQLDIEGALFAATGHDDILHAILTAGHEAMRPNVGLERRAEGTSARSPG